MVVDMVLVVAVAIMVATLIAMLIVVVVVDLASWSGISKFSKKEILLIRLHQNITKKSKVRTVTSNSPVLMLYD